MQVSRGTGRETHSYLFHLPVLLPGESIKLFRSSRL
jgi:hypothetical protein